MQPVPDADLPKLVRNDDRDSMAREGWSPRTRTAAPDELPKLQLKKLWEEWYELGDAPWGSAEAAAEAGDLLQLACDRAGVSLHDAYQAALAKLKRRGGFDDWTVLLGFDAPAPPAGAVPPGPHPGP